MVSQELVAYIANQLHAGFLKEGIINTLRASNYPEEDIQQAFLIISQASEIPSAPGLTIQQPQVAFTKPLASGFNKKIAFLSILIFLLFSLLGAAYYYFNVYLSPERILSEMVKKTQSLKTFNYSIDYEGSYKYSPSSFAASLISASTTQATPANNKKTAPLEKISLLVHANGDYDQTNKDELKASATLRSTFTSEGLSLSVGANFIGYGDYLYGELTEAPSFGFISFKSLENKWIKFPASSTKSSTPELSDAKISQIKKLSLNSKIISKINKLKNEKINNRDSFHYGLTVDQVAFTKFLTEARNILGTTSGSTALNYDRPENELVFKNVEVWIGENDYYLNKISFDVMPQANNASSAFKTEGRITLSLGNHNKPNYITIPTSSQSMEELAKSFMPPSIATQSAPARTTSFRDVNGASTNITEDFLETVEGVGNVGKNSFRYFSLLRLD
jgi:hypothetical protein